MIPDGVLSSQTVAAPFVDPVKQPGQRLVDFERGGVAVQDTSQGLDVKVWTLEVIATDVMLSAPASPRHRLFSATDISEVSLAFDQAMRPFVAYIQAGVAKYWWYDTVTAAQIHSMLGNDVRCVRCTTDEKRRWHLGQSDIVLCYLRGDQLCARYQRERYQTEHSLRTVGSQADLISMGLSRSNRLQWRLRNTLAELAAPDADDALASSQVGAPGVQQKPTVAEVISDLYQRAGVPDAAIEVSDLGAVELDGFKIAAESGADTLVQSLQAAFFFDPVETDRHLIAKSRGGESVKALTMDDLVARDHAALRITRVQQAELLKKVTLTTLDSAIDYVSNTQTAERRSNTIAAKAESSLEIPITATPSFAKSIAEKRLRVGWSEVEKYQFTLSLAHSDLSPGDVVTLTDGQQTVHRLRIGMISEEDGWREIEAVVDEPWIYRDVKGQGVMAAPPRSTAPGSIGDTVVSVLNLPVLNDSDDALGYSITVYGSGSAWTGGELQLSLDGGATVAQRFHVSNSAVTGKTLTTLFAEVSADMPSVQHLDVQTGGDLESVSPDLLQRYRNRAALQHADGSWEVIQFQNAVATKPGMYTLSGIVRGRYATQPNEVPSGARFILLDEAVFFAPLPQWMLQQQMHYRGMSDGQEADAVSWIALPKGQPLLSQTEWPVHGVWSRREPNGTVTVGWIGRARLGIEIAPRHSQYFAGYRVLYSDGFSADTVETMHIRQDVLPELKVRVAPLNRLTGQGPLSEELTV